MPDTDRLLEFFKRVFINPETGAWNKRTLLLVGLGAAVVGALPLLAEGGLPILGAGGPAAAMSGAMIGALAASGMELISPTTTHVEHQGEAPHMGGMDPATLAQQESMSVEVPNTINMRNAERRR